MRYSFATIWTRTVAANATIALCGISTGILSARLLGPLGRGELATLTFWPSIIAAVGMFSLPASLVHLRGQPSADRAGIAAAAIWISFGFAAISSGVGYFVIPLVLSSSDMVGLARYYLLAFIPFNFLGLVLLAVDQSDMRFDRYNLYRLLTPGLYFICLMALWVAGTVSVYTLVWAIWFGTFATTIVRLYSARHLLRQPVSLSNCDRLLRSTMQFHCGAIFALLFAHIDRLVVILFWDSATIGLYAVAITLAMTCLNTVTMAFGELLLPRLAATQDPAKMRRLVAKTLRYSMLMLTVGSGALAILCPWLLPLLFGEAFRGAVEISIVLLFAYVPAALRDIIAKGLRGTGDWSPCLVAEAIALAVFGLATWPLASRFGILGVPIALFIANMFGMTYLLNFVRRRFDLSLHDIWGLGPTTIIEIANHAKRTMSRDK